MNLIDILSPDAVKVPLTAEDKKSAIEELVDLLAEVRSIKNPDALKVAVWQREQQRTTGIGDGLAIPHGKCNSTTELHVALGRPRTPLDFDSVDKRPVHLIILLASPPDKTSEHIQALGKISRLMADPQFREAAYGADTAEALYQLFKDAEKR